MSELGEAARVGLGRAIKGHSVGPWKQKQVSEDELYKYKYVIKELPNGMYLVRIRYELGQNGSPLFIDPGCLTAEGKKDEGVDTLGQTVRFVGKILTDEIMIDLARQAGVPGAFKKLKPSEKLQKRREARLAGKPLKSTNHRNKKKSASSQHGKGATPTSSRSGGHGSSTKTATTAGRTTPARPVTHTSTAGRTASAGHTARPTASKTAATSTKKAKPAKSSSSKKKSTGLGFGKKRR